MTELEIKLYSFLCSVQGIGQQTLWKIKNALHSGVESEDTKNAPEADPNNIRVFDRYFLSDIGVSENKIIAIESRIKEQTIAEYWEWLKNEQIRVVDFESREYPPLLREIENPPLILFAKGIPMDWSTGPPVAVVGTRHITEYGRKVTEKITSELVINGAQIVSGFMYGVDICAHRTALDWEGPTIGVLGYGFKYVYPKSYSSTFEEFLERGMTFITPFAPDVAPSKGNFPARNAIVAGMSTAVVVTEAAEKSGTHITAGYAADFGRAVYAVPGSIFSPYSQGVKALINEGAVLVSDGAEIVPDLPEPV